MKKKIKYIVIGIITTLSFTVLILFNFYIFPDLQSDLNQININEREKKFEVTNISLFVDYSGVKENDFFKDINLTSYETTAYHALANSTVIRVRNFNWGLLVEEINGVGVGWIYWINNDPPPNLPSNYFNLLDNDTVNWKFVS
ncbi:hypothetical protein LCGC14_0639540 [marine sediment metagenome]|uniref:DUF4430 domain-containing protein n=1 Tax=marine sediment metagenome TaxID=412755 RepID=A0A0F9R4W3_9ZZZZ|nr:MAG: hypothetical protein Lokiarch_54070 [Candidatus Lokiarchaeum sp. GC14_75]HEC37225.1 hypothetical protein [bacterium]